MQFLDWVVVAIYLAFVIVIGYRTGRGNKGLDDFFLARRSMPWYAIGLSVMATQASAITLVGTPGQGYIQGMSFIQVYFGLPIAMVILCVTLVPFFYRSRVFTAYEYLEQRFDGKTRSLTSFLFLLGRGLSDAVVIYAPSVVLSIVFGIDEKIIILAIGMGSTIYTSLGGMRAVMWVEVCQMLIIFLGILFCLASVVFGLPDEVTFMSALKLAGSTGRLETFDFNPDPTVTYTFWTGLLGGIFLMLSYFGCDQSQVQRYLTARSLTESRLALLFSAVVKIPMQFVILLTGTLLFVFYQFEKPPVVFNNVALERLKSNTQHAEQYEALQVAYNNAFEGRRASAETFAKALAEGGVVDIERQAFLVANENFENTREEVVELVQLREGPSFSDTNYVFPTFVLTQLPVGVMGLILVAIFAASMSTVESELTSLSTVTVIDFYRRYVTNTETDRHYLIISRVATLFWGTFATFCAFYMGSMGSAIEAVNRIGSYFFGAILGVFILALCVPRANGHGAFAGVAAGILGVQFTIWSGSSISFLYYNLIGAVSAIVVGYLVSIITAHWSNPSRSV